MYEWQSDRYTVLFDYDRRLIVIDAETNEEVCIQYDWYNVARGRQDAEFFAKRLGCEPVPRRIGA